MKCSCPKCSENIEIDSPEDPEKGKAVRCPECSGSFWVQQESFVLRVYKKDWKIYCRHCGKELGPDTYCPGCFRLYPGYWVVQASRPARRQVRRPSPTLRAPSPPRRYRRSADVDAPQTGSAERSAGPAKKSLLVAAVSLILAVVLVAAGTGLYLKRQQEQAFTENFVLTLYGIKSGTDQSLGQLDAMIASHQRPTAREVADLKSVQTEIERYRKKLAPPPDRFHKSLELLENYYGIYSDLLELAMTSSGASPGLPAQIESIKDSAGKAEKDLKNNLADPLLAQVQKVAPRYRSLQFMIR